MKTPSKLITSLVARLPWFVANAALGVSPRPSAFLFRRSFEAASEQAASKLARHVPHGVRARLDLRYDASDDDAVLDLFSPSKVSREEALPIVVWLHGGGWLSGSHRHLENYARLLASFGYAVATVNYSLAPRATYPVPVRQVVRALEYLKRHARRFGLDSTRFFLAGDSAGAQLAAQVANLVTSPAYAAKIGVFATLDVSDLAGVILYCGVYRLESLDLDGELETMLKTVLWTYSGTRAFEQSEKFRTFSVKNYLTPSFPPSFVSAGNRDPLAPQSLELAKALSELGVEVDALFFPASYEPPLEHEYQFDLDTQAGKLALERSLAFLEAYSNPRQGRGPLAFKSGA